MHWNKLTVCSLMMAMVLYVSVGAEEDENARLQKMQETIDRILSKAGIDFSGEFRSQFMNSNVDGDAVNKQRRVTETVEYTSVDFDIQARPNTAVSGRAILRLHQDWRIFFTDLGNPVNARWLSIDGRILNNTCGYNLGYFRKKYSPLTLYSPDIEIPFEPEIFAGNRQKAMQELFLGDNNRINQGLNYDIDVAVKPIFKELHWNIMGTRLRLSETTLDNANFVTLDRDSKMDKYCVGTNLDLVFIPDMTFGFSYLNIFDWKSTINKDVDITSDIMQSDTLAQKTPIIDFRAGAGTAPFIDPKKVNFRLVGEFAYSSDDSSFVIVDTVAKDTALDSEKIGGKALAVNLLGSVGLGTVGNVKLNLGFRMNDRDYRNEMAQTPSYIPNRIMNSENDFRNVDNNVSDTLYSSFDALYRHVYKFAASGQNGYVRRPIRKISYGNGILTRNELARLSLDPAVQLIMPFGPATPNRTGVEGDLSVQLFDNGVKAGVSFLSMNEISAKDSLFIDTNVFVPQKSSFSEVGFGASVDMASFIKPLNRPLRVSGSYKLSKAANDGDAAIAVTKCETNVTWINAGFYWNFWKRASLLAGFQRIEMTDDPYFSDATYTILQNQWATGLEYRVNEGGSITGTVGQVSGSQDCDDPSVDLSGRDFTQMQVDLFLTVKF